MKKEIPKPSITAVFEHYGARVLGADTGGWQKATCALNDHDDHSPSASVNESEAKWKCWGCNKGGDPIDLIMENDNVGFAAAVKTAESFLDGSSGSVQQSDHQSSSLLPHRTGSRAGRRQWSPSWRVL